MDNGSIEFVQRPVEVSEKWQKGGVTNPDDVAVLEGKGIKPEDCHALYAHLSDGDRYECVLHYWKKL